MVDGISSLAITGMAISHGSLPEFIQLKLAMNALTHVSMDMLDRPVNKFLQQRRIRSARIPAHYNR